MDPIGIFFLVMAVTFIVPILLSRLRIPQVTALMIGGAVLGANGIGMLPNSEAIVFLAQIGLVFLLFTIGLQFSPSSFHNVKKDAGLFALFNGGLPFAAGYFSGQWLGLPVYSSLALGAVYAASCIATVSGALDELKLASSRFGAAIIVGLILIDGISLLIFGVVTQASVGGFSSMLGNVFLTVVFLYASLRLVPFVHRLVHAHYFSSDFEEEMRLALLVLSVIVFIAGLLGMQPILGAFFAGLALSGVFKTRLMHAKIHALAYGFLVPFFFIYAGMQADLSALFSPSSLDVILLVNISLITTKIIGGFAAGILSGFSYRESVALGFLSLPQLSATLAMMAAGVYIGIFSQDLLTATLIMSVVTVLGGPFVAVALMKGQKKKKKQSRR